MILTLLKKHVHYKRILIHERCLPNPVNDHHPVKDYIKPIIRKCMQIQRITISFFNNLVAGKKTWKALLSQVFIRSTSKFEVFDFEIIKFPGNRCVHRNAI